MELSGWPKPILFRVKVPIKGAKFWENHSNFGYSWFITKISYLKTKQ